MARFVFVHGAWHGAWCWQALLDELERRGHETRAVDLPCDTVGLTVRDYAATVGPQPNAVVVGHSLGGLTIPLVRASGWVFLAALVPADGIAARAMHPAFTGTRRDEHGRSYWPDEETARKRLYPDLAPTRPPGPSPSSARRRPSTASSGCPGDGVPPS